MKTRLTTAAVGVPLIVIILFVLPKIFAAIAFAAAAAIGAYELLWRTKLLKHPRLLVYSCVAAAAVCFWSYCKMQYTFGILIFLLFTVALFAEVLASGGKLRLEKIGICYFAGLIVPYLLSAGLRILTFANGRFLVVFPFILSFLVDVGAYLVGMRFGKHKLAPVISPKKTWEGVSGSLTAGVAGMLLYCLILQVGFQFEVNYFYAVLYGMIGAAASVFGDLIFSVIKRQVGIKDYGTILPGHGGIMDRFDSMVIVAPLVEVLLVQLPVVMK